jgi:hypothetical protein
MKLGWEVSNEINKSLGQQIDTLFQLAELDNTVIDLNKPIKITSYLGTDERIRVFSVEFEPVS